ncbi:hypothetical protein BC834DRAFT_921892 [Gloeopeniophorella convolvens]|nr:hypothetical protein BC834DRAFT_921892 [Gloeopeniophorella convolvens]
MLFPFTFSMSVPGIMNPFSRSQDSYVDSSPPVAATPPTRTTPRREEKPRPLPAHRPHSSSLPIPTPLAKKRGWQPSSPEPSVATAVPTSTSGYLDTPAKYRDFTITPEAREEDGTGGSEADLPPAKRRRTFAGTIVSGAVSAALIGTAVGLTVYRLWRDRGKLPELEPPPYEQGDWVASESEAAAPSINATPSTPRHKKTRATPTAVRRSATRHRKTRAQVKLPVSPPRQSRQPSPQRPVNVRPEFDFDNSTEPVDEFDKMDWMGSRLAQLIEDGKKALGKEVVVMSEAQEDEEDDGSGNWEEEVDPKASMSRTSLSGSIRRKGRPQALGTSSASYSSPFLSPPPTASPRRPHLREDGSEWQSPELRDSMERARAAYLRSRP